MKIRVLILLLLFLAPGRDSFAFWMWTPETNKWVNPKFSVKDTPGEQLAYAKEIAASKDYKKAVDEFNKLVKYYPRSKEAPEAKYFIGQCMEDQERFYDAFKSYQEVIEKYPFSERSPEIVGKQYAIGNKLLEGGRARFIGGVLGSDYDVVDVFRTIIKNAPYGEFAAPSQYKIGLYLHEKLLYQEARDEFEKVINDYPESEWSKAAQYQIALSDSKRSAEAQYDQKVTQSAVQEFNEFVKANPDAELSSNAQREIHKLREKEAENNFLVANFYEKQKNFKAAKLYYNSIVDNFPNTPSAAKALAKIRQLSEK